MKFLACLFAFTATATLHADPQLTSWFTTNSGKYARIYQSTANETAGTTSTTWTRGSGTQSSPAYADVSEINYSTSWIYIRTTGLASHIMGPWYLDSAKSQNFPNFPSNLSTSTTASIYRIPRTPAIPTTKSSTGLGATGRMVNGVSMFDSRDAFSYVNASSTDATPVNGLTGDGVWNRDGWFNEGVTFDPALAHQAGNVYHYHAQPIALRYQLGDHVDYNATTNRYTESAATPTAHSPILAWAADGLPVYGPYGYSDPTSATSGVRRMVSGFTLRDGTNGTTAITTRTALPAWASRIQTTAGTTFKSGPAVNTTYALGHYIEDFDYRGDLAGQVQTTGATVRDFDLNEQNVRFCVTPEFPSGTWAYFTPINADSTPQFPYTTGRQYYGNPTGGTATSISESVTQQFIGGANKALTVSTPSVSGTTVTLTWSAVEGGTYSVDASAVSNFSSFTNKASGIVSTGISANSTYTALSTSGTEYGRVNRTALPTYDANGQTAATAAQSTTTSYTLTPNTPPTISAIGNQSTAMNTATGAIAFTVGDAETAVASLTVSGSSSNVTLVPNANIIFGGSGTSRTLTVTPAQSQTGTSTITVGVNDGSTTTSTTFTLTVTGTNTAPTISAITSQSTTQNTATGAIAFTIGDADTGAASLTLSVASSNATLVPNANIVLGGSGASRTVTVTPATNQTGTSTITITVSDNAATANASFTLTVTATAPVITSIATTPAVPTNADTVTVSANVTPSSGRTLSSVQLTYDTNSGTGTAFSDTMTATAVSPWAGAGTGNTWSIAYTSPTNPFSLTNAANYPSAGTGTQCGLSCAGGPPALTSTITSSAVNAAATTATVDFYLATSGLNGTTGWEFRTAPNGTTFTKRVSEATGSNHAYQHYTYALTASELTSTLKLQFAFSGPPGTAIYLDNITVTVGGVSSPVTVAMNNTGGSTYSATIPAQTIGTAVSYTIKATDNTAANTTSSSASYTVVTPAPVLAVTPAAALTSSGPVGGSFSPASASYTITNSGVGAMIWSAGKTQSWFTLSATGGTLAVGASTTVTATINSAASALAVGNYTDTITFTNTSNGAGNTTRSASLAVLSTNADLTGLTLSAGTLTPTFSSGTLNYTASVANSVTSTTITPTLSDTSATILVNGVAVSSGAASGAMSLAVGANTINTAVTAQDGATVKTYSVVVTRQSAVQSWRQTWFSTTSNSGSAADSADPYHTGLTNLAVFAFLGPNQNPATATLSQLPQAQMSGGNFFFSFTQPAGVSGITYGAEWCADFSAGWTAVSDTGSGTLHVFSVAIGSNAKIFMRLRVSSP